MQNIKATESYGDPQNKNLFTTYFPFIDSFTNGGIYSQIISGVIEYLFIVSAIFPQLLPYTSYELALGVALGIGCIVVTIVEIGQRTSLKAASKAFFNKQYKTRIEKILFAFAFVSWLGLVGTSIALSILPVKEVLTPVATSADTYVLDSLHRSDIVTIEANQIQKVDNTKEVFSGQIKAIESKYDAKVNSSNVAIKKHRKNLANGNKWAASHITKEKENIAAYEVSKTNEIAVINESLNNEINEIEAYYNKKSNDNDSLYQSDKSDILATHTANENSKIKTSNIYTYSITVLICVCILLTSFSIFVKESFIKGSEIEVTNEIENKLEPIIPRLWIKLCVKLYFFFDKYANMSDELKQKYNARTSSTTTKNTPPQPTTQPTTQIGFSLQNNTDTEQSDTSNINANMSDYASTSIQTDTRRNDTKRYKTKTTDKKLIELRKEVTKLQGYKRTYNRRLSTPEGNTENNRNKVGELLTTIAELKKQIKKRKAIIEQQDSTFKLHDRIEVNEGSEGGGLQGTIIEVCKDYTFYQYVVKFDKEAFGAEQQNTYLESEITKR